MRSGYKKSRNGFAFNIIIWVIVDTRHDACVFYSAAGILKQVIDAACVNAVSVEYGKFRRTVCVQIVECK